MFLNRVLLGLEPRAFAALSKRLKPFEASLIEPLSMAAMRRSHQQLGMKKPRRLRRGPSIVDYSSA
jgi:hypothetical protein